MSTVISSYSATPTTGQGFTLSIPQVYQTFTTASTTPLTSAKLALQKVANPTGSIVYKVYAITGTGGSTATPTGSALQTSGTLDPSTVIAAVDATTPYQLYELYFTGASLPAGQYALVAEITGGNTGSVNFLRVGITGTGGGALSGENPGRFQSGAYIPFAGDAPYEVRGGDIVTQRTQTGVARITQVVPQNQNGHAFIAPIASPYIEQSLYGFTILGTTFWGDSPYVANTVSTPKTQTGVARVTATTTRTQTGKARIQVTVPKTQTGIARITKVVPRTQTGVARITATTARTQTGIARITKIVARTQTGISRITQVVPRTQTGVARITASTARTQTGKARIQTTVAKTQTGIARITAITARTITGLATIISSSIVTTRNTTGVARITATTARTQLGKAAILKTVQRTQTGVARIGLVTTKTQLGVARITKSVPRTQTGIARITVSTTRTQTGIARITASTARTQTGRAKITATTTQTTTGRARIQIATTRIITGIARITAVVPRNITGRAAIIRTTQQTITGVARLAIGYNKTITGVARIVKGRSYEDKPNVSIVTEKATTSIALTVIPVDMNSPKPSISIDTGKVKIDTLQDVITLR